jgi:cytoskeletal protein CcmA (bactofilin family)
MCVLSHIELTFNARLMGLAAGERHMGDTIRGDRITIDGAGKYDDVDCETFVVNGTGKVSGDLFAATATINGTAKIEGRVDATTFDVDGTAKVGGGVRGDVVTVDGTAKFRSDVTADRVEVDGTAKIVGDASGSEFVADGTLKVDGNLDGHDVECDGTAKVSGSVVAADARFDGSAKVGGLTDVTDLVVDGSGKFGDVNADALTASGSLRAGDVAARRFELTLEDESRADSVRATEVVVRAGESGPSLGKKLLGRGDAVFAVDTVEGETVNLDATDAETVVGDRVTLGPDASVDVVYSDDLDAAPDADVGDVRPRDAY